MWDDVSVGNMVELPFDEIMHKTYDNDGDVLAWRVDFGFAIEWIAASQCDIDTKNKTIEMPTWVAEDKELI
jgi:hypothetical protein